VTLAKFRENLRKDVGESWLKKETDENKGPSLFDRL